MRAEEIAEVEVLDLPDLFVKRDMRDMLSRRRAGRVRS